MKKTFRTILAGAVAVLAVSCYDDSALNSKIDKLDDRVSAIENTLNAEVGGINDLAARLSAAETSLGTLNTDVTTLKSQVTTILTQLDAIDGKIDGAIEDIESAIEGLVEKDEKLSADILDAVAKIAVFNVEEKNGNVVLTLADNTEISLSKPLANVENSGLVTVVEGMWATVNADGTTTSLEVPVGHPDYKMEFEVSENGELMFIVNDGEPQSTGVTTSDLSGADFLITDIQEEEDVVVITVGDSSYTLLKYVVDNSVVVIKAGKTYFAYGQTKEFDLRLEEISDLYVMSKPDGWKAVLSENTLVVTAPVEANTYAETEGEVLLHGTTDDGACKIAKLAVTTEEGVTVSIDPDEMVLTIRNAMVGELRQYTFMGWETVLGFLPLQIGLAVTTDLFEEDFEEYYEKMKNYELDDADYAGRLDNIYFNINQVSPPQYEEGVCEVEEYVFDLSDFFKEMSYRDLEAGESFIVWVAPFADENQSEISISELTFAYYTPGAKAEQIGDAGTSDISLKLSLFGADAYYVGYVPEKYAMDNMTGEPSLEAYLNNMLPDLQYGENYLGKYYEESGIYEAEVSSLIPPERQEAPLSPNSNHFVYILPVFEGKLDYAFEDVIVYEFETAALQSGSTATVEIEEAESTFTSISAYITPSDDAEIVYYNFFEEDAEITADDIIANGYVVLVGEENIIASESVSTPGTQMVLAALAVDADGKYGEIKSLILQSKDLVYSTTVTASIDTPTYEPAKVAGGYAYKFPVTLTEGAIATQYCYAFDTMKYSVSKMNKLPLGSGGNIYSLKTSDPTGQIVNDYLTAGRTYYLYLTVELENGEYTPVIEYVVNVPAQSEE